MLGSVWSSRGSFSQFASMGSTLCRIRHGAARREPRADRGGWLGRARSSRQPSDTLCSPALLAGNHLPAAALRETPGLLGYVVANRCMLALAVLMLRSRGKDVLIR